MLLSIRGLLPSIVLAIALSSCRADKPPSIILCIGDGFGGADCKTPKGEYTYRSPSELENAWITTQEDAARLLSWCYDTRLSVKNLQAIEAEIKALGQP